MKMVDKILRVIMAVAVILFVMSMFCKCTTVRYVPVTEYRDRYVNKTDTLMKTDSVWVHDSISVLVRGDTVFKDKYSIKYRDRFVYRNKSDTVMIRDSIPYKVVEQTKLSKTDKMFLKIGKVSSVCLFVGILAIFGWIFWRLKLHWRS